MVDDGALLGLGFTFFSGATEAWLVDALNATGFTGDLESVFGRAQVRASAQVLDVCLANPDRDEAVDMEQFMATLDPSQVSAPARSAPTARS